jgi:transposase
MARDKSYDYAEMVMIPLSLEKQLRPGTWEFAIHALVQRRVDTSIFAGRDKNDETGCPAYDPKLWLKVVLVAYSRGIISSRKIEQAGRENMTFMALTCGLIPDHSTIAAFVSSRQEEIVSLFRDILLVCEEQGVLGGTHFALDGLKLSSKAAKEWSGTVDDWRRKQEKWAEKVKSLVAQHAAADQEGEAAIAKGHGAEQETIHAQVEKLEKQAARIDAFLEPHEPKRGKRGKARQSNVTDNESATMQTAHGVIQGYNGQAFVDAKPQVMMHAEAFGSGQDDGHVAPMLEGAQANAPARGLPEPYVAGKLLSADSNDHRAEKLKSCAQAQVDASIPDPHVRQRDPRVATQERHKLPMDEKCTLADVIYDNEQDCYMCPQGKLLKLEARQHKIGNRIYRRYEAEEADCRVCPLREKCLQTVETCCKHLAVWVENVKETLSQQMIVKIDTLEARKIDGLRLAIVEPVFGNIRSQKRLDRFTLRGRIKVNIQWMFSCLVHNLEKLVNYGLVRWKPREEQVVLNLGQRRSPHQVRVEACADPASVMAG